MTHSPNPAPSTPALRTKTGFTHESRMRATGEWYTPPAIFTALGIDRFEMEVCSPGAEKTHVPANIHLTIDDDDLTTPWRCTVWMNPPYSDIAPWMTKLSQHGDGIALVFVRPDTKWFQSALTHATAVCFIAGRIRFIDGPTGEQSKGSPGCGSVLIAYGENASTAVEAAGLGFCVRLSSAS